METGQYAPWSGKTSSVCGSLHVPRLTKEHAEYTFFPDILLKLYSCDGRLLQAKRVNTLHKRRGIGAYHTHHNGYSPNIPNLATEASRASPRLHSLKTDWLTRPSKAGCLHIRTILTTTRGRSSLCLSEGHQREGITERVEHVLG